jgi:hypothetical protein
MEVGTKLKLTCLALCSACASAQWLHYPTAGIPRTPGGKPNLSAPAPKTPDGKPDLSGLWKAPGPKYLFDLAADLDPKDVPFQPWAAELYAKRAASLAVDRPSGRCIPHGVPDQVAVPGYPFKILQLPGLIVFLYEEMTHFRQIFTDGRPLPKDPNPAWLGYSIGHWEGDTLVVETTGFREESWLDDPGHPHSDALRVFERIRRPNFGRLEIHVTIDDPKAYTRPWSANEIFDYLPDTDLIENYCENEKDLQHLVGK